MNEITVSGFSWDHLDRLCQFVATKNRDGSVEEDWVPILPFNLEPTRALQEDSDVKVVECTLTYVDGSRRDVALSAELISVSRPSDLLRRETGIDISHKEALKLAEFLSVIVHRGSTVPLEEVATTAKWAGDELVVPGTSACSPRKKFAELAKYGALRGDERAAKRAWSEVLQFAVIPENEKLLLILGMPLGSLFAARLRRAPYRFDTATFALHLAGESAHGKTQAAVSAMMMVGDATEKAEASNLYRTWNLSAQAPIALAHQLGVLPIFFDEAAASDREPEQFTQMLFDLAQGTERQRATVTGDLDEVDRWECCVLSTGETRLTAKSGLVGVRRRVQELYVPFAEKQYMDRVFERASAFHGWPLRWVALQPDVAAAAELFPKIRSNFEDGPTWLNQASTNLAVCGLGSLLLARLLDVDEVTPKTVHDAVARVVRRAGREAVEEGVNAGIRLLKAVWSAAAKRPNSFPAKDDPPALGREREGMLFQDGSIGVLDDAALQRIAAEVGLPDYKAGLRLLKEQNLLVTESGRDKVARTVKQADGSVQRRRMYVFLPLAERDQ